MDALAELENEVRDIRDVALVRRLGAVERVRLTSFHLATVRAVRRAGYEPLLLDFPKVPWDDADALVETIEREGPETIAAFLFEPITGAAGACQGAAR